MDKVQDMIKNHESCRIVNNRDGTTEVLLRPDEIAFRLQGKMSEQDIAKSMDILCEQFKYQKLIGDLYRQCNNVSCANRDKCSFRAIPNGSVSSPVMFINKMPSEYEAYGMCSHNDKASAMFTIMLDKMNVSRKDVYCTDMIKCCCDDLDEISFNNCINSYLVQEIVYVKPKVIIFNGMVALKTMVKMGHITGLPDDITYGKMYDVTITQLNIPLKVMPIYDLDNVLQKTGNKVTECKTVLWQNALVAFREAGLIPPAT